MNHTAVWEIAKFPKVHVQMLEMSSFLSKYNNDIHSEYRAKFSGENVGWLMFMLQGSHKTEHIEIREFELSH